MESKLRTHSLAQDQEAERIIQNTLTSGELIFLQNCHLSVSWLPELEAIFF
jgi:dynein heavy chain